MQYRKIHKIDISPSLLGFGCMRLPIIDGDDSKIDEEKAIKIIRYGIDNGITYIDTAYNYHNGNSEILVGKALLGGYRERVYLATKLPVWLIKTYHECEKYLNEQLEKLQTNYIDFYLLHSLTANTWKKVKELKILDFMKDMVSKGKIRYIGFSFHDNVEVFKDIVDSFPWDFCQIQLNYMDENYQAGIEGLKYAANKGLGVIIMEPLKGGRLSNPPREVAQIFNESEIKASPSEWALKWLCNMPEISVILSGMSNLDQVIENIATISNTPANSLTEEELKIIKKAKEEFEKLTKVSCTNCKYCLPCPQGVNIPRNFTLYNNAFVYGEFDSSRKKYGKLKDDERASNCIECKKCEDLCPQNIKISECLKDVHKVLSSDTEE